MMLEEFLYVTNYKHNDYANLWGYVWWI